MKKIFYILCFSFLGVLVGFLAHALIEWPLIFLLDRNFERYSLGFNWSQWFVIHNVGTALLLFAGGLFGLSQGFLWWRILYVEKRRFGHHAQAIVLDFDHTLFNTTLYVKSLQEVFAKEFNITPSDFMKYRNAVKTCCEVIDIDQFIGSLPDNNRKAMHRTIYDFIKEKAAEFIFSDVRYFIEQHKNSFDIILLTHGDKELQEEKISHSNLPKVTKTIITKRPKVDVIDDLLEEYQKVHYMDDKADIVDKIKTTFPEVVAYFVARPEDHPYGNRRPACDCADHEVSGLNFKVES